MSDQIMPFRSTQAASGTADPKHTTEQGWTEWVDGKLFGFTLPIRADLDHRGGGAHQIVDAKGLALFFESTGWIEDEREKMAHWFAAACNALAGIPDPAAFVSRAKVAEALAEQLLESRDFIADPVLVDAYRRAKGGK